MVKGLEEAVWGVAEGTQPARPGGDWGHTSLWVTASLWGESEQVLISYSLISDRTRRNGTKLSQGRFRLDIRKGFLTQQSSRSFWTTPSGTWCDSWGQSCEGPGVELHDIDGSLPTYYIPWFLWSFVNSKKEQILKKQSGTSLIPGLKPFSEMIRYIRRKIFCLKFGFFFFFVGW